MGQFEYVMVLVSIVIGLAITHLLNALAAAIHRLRGHGPPLRLESVYLLWMVFVLTWLVSFWWWEFKFQETAEAWSFGLYLFVIAYAVALFLLAAVLVPSRMIGVDDTYEYFMDGRHWFFLGVLSITALDVVDTFLKSSEWGLRPSYLLQVVVLVVAAVAGILSTRRSVQLASATAGVVTQLTYMFMEVGILGSW